MTSPFQCIPLYLQGIVTYVPDYADHLHSQTDHVFGQGTPYRFGENKVKEIRSFAADSFGVRFAKNAFSFQIRQLIEQLMFLKNQIEKLGEQIVFSGLNVSDEFTATKHKILQTRLSLFPIFGGLFDLLPTGQHFAIILCQNTTSY